MPPRSHSGVALQPSLNLSDLTNVPLARTNLGLGAAAEKALSYFALASHTHDISSITNLQDSLDDKLDADSDLILTNDQKNALAGTQGTPSASNPFVTNTDPRLSDSRTPTAHTHLINTLPVADDGESNANELVRSNDSRLSNARTPLSHSHGISDLPVAGDGEDSATMVVRADDSRLSDSRSSIGSSLTSGQVIIGNSDNEAEGFAITGDISLTNAGVVAVNKIKGTSVSRFLFGSASLNFGFITTGGTATANITVTGATVGDVVSIGGPNSSFPGIAFFGYVSGTNTVTVKAINASGDTVNVGTQTYKVLVIG